MKSSDLFSRSSSGSHLAAVGRWAKQRRLLLIAVAVVAIGLALGWQWLAAIGVLPIVLGTLPCAFMMGMCMKGMSSSSGGDTCSKDTLSKDIPDTGDGEFSPGSPPASLPDASSTTPKKETLHA